MTTESEPIDLRGLAQIQSRYPQSHIDTNALGSALVIVPGFTLTSDWSHTICTVLFLKPLGFPATNPHRFWVDVPLRVRASMAWPVWSRPDSDISGFPQWRDLTLFWWRLQAWDPNRDSLYTWLMAIRMRLKGAR